MAGCRLASNEVGHIMSRETHDSHDAVGTGKSDAGVQRFGADPAQGSAHMSTNILSLNRNELETSSLRYGKKEYQNTDGLHHESSTP